jgi:hypothetical protein
LRSYGARCFLRIAKAINMLLLRSKSRCVKYVDAQIRGINAISSTSSAAERLPRLSIY